jgi:hypothetical protein
MLVSGCGEGKPGAAGKENKKLHATAKVVEVTVSRDGETIVPLKETTVPQAIRVDRNHIYITQSHSVLIYSRKDFSLKKKIGSRGEGPGEFRLPLVDEKLSFKVFPEYLFIGSMQKGSYFTKDGVFIKDQRLSEFTLSGHVPFDDDYAGYQHRIVKEERTAGIFYKVFALYDSNGTLNKELCQYRDTKFYEENGFIDDFVAKQMILETYGERIYVSGRRGFVIEIFDDDGDRLKPLTYGFAGRKLNEREKKAVYDVYEDFYSRYRNGRYWPRAKRLLQIPEQFPAFYTFFIADEKIYVQAYKNETDDSAMVFVFDLEGNLSGKISLPLLWVDIIRPHIYTIKDNTLFQVTPNENTETDELHIIRMI